MRTLLSFAFLAAALVHLRADSYRFTIEQKVAACTAIVRVSVTEATPPQTKSPLDPAVCKAKVLEVLKGPTDLKEVEFRFRAVGIFSPDKLPQMVGKEYIVFLHEPPLPGLPPNQRWVFEGTSGIRPIADQSIESRPKRRSRQRHSATAILS